MIASRRRRVRLKSLTGGIVSASALIAMTGSVAAEPEPAILQPASVWGLNYAADSCVISRTFGTGQDEVTLEFHQFAPGKTFTLLAAGRSLKHARQAPIVTQFEPDGDRHEDESGMSGTLADGRSVLETSAKLLPAPDNAVAGGQPKKSGWTGNEEDAKPLTFDPQSEAKITRLRLSGPIAHDIVLAIGPMNKPMAALRTCLEELVTHWGIDPAVDKTLIRRAAPSNYPGTWATPQDYPTEMLLKAKSAIIHFRLMVNAQGKPTSCVVQTPGDPAFNKATCDLMMQRARFNPALNASGQPVPSYYVSTVRWLT